MITVNPWLWLVGITAWGVIVGTVWGIVLSWLLDKRGLKWR